jgi:hypothetical protein
MSVRVDCTRKAYGCHYREQDAGPVELPAGAALIFDGYLLHRSAHRLLQIERPPLSRDLTLPPPTSGRTTPRPSVPRTTQVDGSPDEAKVGPEMMRAISG